MCALVMLLTKANYLLTYLHCTRMTEGGQRGCSTGSLFHASEAATASARSPKVDRIIDNSAVNASTGYYIRNWPIMTAVSCCIASQDSNGRLLPAPLLSSVHQTNL